MAGGIAVLFVASAGHVGAQVYPPDNRTCGIQLSASSAAPDQTITVTGTQGGANVVVDLFIESDPIFLASTTTDAEGRFTQRVVIPQNVGDGTHRIVAEGRAQCSASITIVSAANNAEAGVPRTTATRAVGPGLAFTGADTLGVVLVALVVLTVGIALYAAERRNSSVREARRARRRESHLPAAR